MNLFVFINDSKGELDWIAPFLTSKELSNVSIDIYLHNIENSKEALNKIIIDYELNKHNITILKFDSIIYRIFKKYDNIFEKVLSILKEKNIYMYRIIYSLYMSSLNFFALFNFIFRNQKYHFIFRDYNLKDSILLFSLIKYNPQAKIVIFPHAFGIQRLPRWAKLKTPQKKVKCNLYLENTFLSTRALEVYSKSFFASGAPILALNYNKEVLFDLNSKNVLILLRDAYERYGCSDEEAFKTFKQNILFLTKNNYHIFVKVHPRKNNLQKKFLDEINIYDTVHLYNESLISLNKKFIFCLTFFSTAGLFLTSQRVPVFDITKYRECTDSRVEGSLTHFCHEGRLTHYLLYFGIQDRIGDLDKLLNKEYLTKISNKQYLKMKSYYPEDSNQNILKKLKELND